MSLERVTMRASCGSWALACLLLGGCASGGTNATDGGGRPPSDAFNSPTPDAGMGVDAGGARDAGMDACPDDDGDGVCNAYDGCSAGDDGADGDGDGVPDACDCDASAATVCSPDAACMDGVDGVTCACNDGFTGDGRTCSPVDCGALSAPMNGTVDAPATTFGSTATYGCDMGYNLVGDMTRMCQADGTWSGSEPTCLIGDCGPLTSPENGTVMASSTTVGAVATYSCNTGYSLVGDMTRTCRADRTWSGSAPSCFVVDCGTLSPPSHGMVSAPTTTYMSVATYSCSTGYTLSGSATRTCRADGSWSGSAPSCPIVDCGPLTAPSHGSVSVPATTYMSVATYSCMSGYTLSGSTTRTCQASGAWSGSAPSCVTMGCGMLSPPSNGTVSVPSTAVGSRATYMCNSGYQILGSPSRVCWPDLSWAGSAPMCGMALTCGCSGMFIEGERVIASVDNPSGATPVAMGTYGTVIAGNAPPSTLQILVQWDGWTGGHDGNCSVADCGTCTPRPALGRWWTACDQFRTARLTCACGGAFAQGDRVVAQVDSPAGASGIMRGRMGTVVAGMTGAAGSLTILIQWDSWTSGHNGNCSFAECGTCVASPTNNRWWVHCEDIAKI